MAKYRKRPVVIEAEQWVGGAESASRVIDWVLDSGTRSARYHEGPGEFIAIDTLEGTMSAIPNDFIIRGVQGEHYPCKPDIFEQTYEPVGDE